MEQMKNNKNMTLTRATGMGSVQTIYATKANIEAIKTFIGGKATGKTTTTARALKTRGMANLNMAFGFVGKMRQWKRKNIHRIATDATLLQKEINKSFGLLPPPVKGVVASMANDLLKKKEQKKATPEIIEVRPVTTWGESEMGLAEDFQEGEQYADAGSESGSGVDDWEELADDDEFETPVVAPTLEKIELESPPQVEPETVPTTTVRGWNVEVVKAEELSKEFRMANPPLAASRTPSPQPYQMTKIIIGPRTNQKDRRKNPKTIVVDPREVKAPAAVQRTRAFEKLKKPVKLEKTRPCRHVLNKKTCRHGAKCKFAHCASELCLVECAFGKTCRKGIACTYFHPERETRCQFIRRCFPTLPQ